MPAASGYSAKDYDDAATREMSARRSAIETGWQYYYGDHPLPLRVRNNRDDNVIHNLNGQALDDMVAAMGVPRFEVAGGVSREPDENGYLRQTMSGEQVFVERWWDAHDLAEFIVDMFLSGFVTGHVFVRLYYPPTPSADMSSMPRAALLDSRTVTVFWNETDWREAFWYSLRWKQNGKDRKQDIVRGSLLTDAKYPDGWVILEYVQHDTLGWELVHRDDWAFPFAPIVEWKNEHKPHEYYGRSDIRARLNAAINTVSSKTNKILSNHAAPQTVLVGAVLPDDLQTGSDHILEVPSPDARLFNLEMQSDLSSSMAYLKMLRETFFAEARVVDLASIGDKLGNITNFGVRVLFSRMIALIDGRRQLYGKGLREITLRMLAMANVQVDEVRVLWQDVLPINRLEMLQALQLETQIGTLSRQTIAEELGRDFDLELERTEEERVRVRDGVADTLIRMGERGLLGDGT